MKRLSNRLVIACAAAALLLSGLFVSSAQAQQKKILFLTKSSGFQHSVITRDPKHPEKLAWAERILTEIGAKHGFQITCTKDASLLDDPATYQKYDVFAFYTTGDLTRDSSHLAKLGPDGKPERDAQNRVIMDPRYVEKGMSPAGKKMFLQAIRDGKGFIGFHCASDTFHSREHNQIVRPEDESKVDPYIDMLGGEFLIHGSQQKSVIHVVPGFPELGKLNDYSMTEEWYSLVNLDPGMHAILIQDTNTMVGPRGKEKIYDRAPYPETWAKMYGKGRVFYTSMGHREDVWTNPIFHEVVTAGLDWASGKTDADVKANMLEVTPQPAK